MGGIGGKKMLSSTEYISLDGSASQPGPELPLPRSRHCAVKLRTGKVMIIGGGLDEEIQQNVIIFDPDAKTFVHSLPSLNYARFGLGCAVFNSTMHENREVVLAVGGYGQATAEVYDYTQPYAVWTQSNY